jgi:hypothetical protein
VTQGPVADSVEQVDVDIAGAEARSALLWAQAIFEQAPHAVRTFLVLGWRFGLGLRLAASGTPGHVIGWSVVSDDEDEVRLAAEGKLLAAVQTVRVEGGRLVLQSAVTYRSALGRLLWLAAVPLHRLTSPYLLRRAANTKT